MSARAIAAACAAILAASACATTDTAPRAVRVSDVPHTYRTAEPSPTPREALSKPVKRAYGTIHGYRVCQTNPQPCVDKGLTLYGGKILAGHNYMGFQWLSRVPVGERIEITDGPMRGTYRVYGHLRIPRRGGAFPDFGRASLVLQTCEGTRSTGFSLAARV
ncbi:hypothetical protein [Streptomyces sp. NPDC007063]|uniref:hypothetical protein n=1 Tax=Streptomyces sp. NPDC007063 TaxID=3364772 RepID=UPI00369B159C